MSRPSVAPDFATDANYPAGTDPWSGQPTKVQPSAGETGTGFIPESPLAADEINFVLNNHAAWLTFIDTAVGGGLFGDGSDGNASIAADVSLARDMYYENLTINSGHVIDAHGYRVFVRDTLTIQSTAVLANDGAAAVGNVHGDGGTAEAIGGGEVGGNGRANTTGLPGVDASASLGGSGGAGGAGTNAGGIAGVATAPSASYGGLRSLTGLMTGYLFGATTLTRVQGGAGGGGGGSNNNDTYGGGGGGGGGALLVAARTIVNNGRISANGGNGANASGAHVGGGGGGGGGGLVLLTYYVMTGSGTVTAAGGTKGTKVGTGGVNGSDGSAGTVITVPISTSATAPALALPSAEGVTAMSSSGSGNGVDYLDVSFGFDFGTTAYKFEFSAYNSGNTDEVPLTLVSKTQTTMRIQPGAPFDGEISWRAWL